MTTSEALSAGPDAGEPAAVPPAGRSGPARSWAAVVVAVVTLGAVFGFVALLAARGSGQQLHFVVPAGTGDRIDRGERVEIIPPDLEVRVGDELIVENRDDRAHVIGPFSVQAGETLRHTFDRPGVYEGFCSVHSSDRVRITVR